MWKGKRLVHKLVRAIDHLLKNYNLDVHQEFKEGNKLITKIVSI